MTISIQMILLVGVPFMIIYTALISGYSYGKGFKEGFDLAKNYAELILKKEFCKDCISREADKAETE